MREEEGVEEERVEVVASPCDDAGLRVNKEVYRYTYIRHPRHSHNGGVCAMTMMSEGRMMMMSR